MSDKANEESPRIGSARTTAPLSGGQATRTKRVLLVDDHGVFREVLGIVLEHHVGFGQSVQAGTVAEARRALEDEQRKGELDLAIVDLDLPGGDGFELLEAMREAVPDVPVIGVTANTDHRLRARAWAAGVSEVIATSATGEEIVAAAGRLGR